MKRMVTYVLLASAAGCAHSPCDINDDGKVNDFDFQVFQWAFGSKRGDHNFMPELDLDHDDRISGTDFKLYTEQCKGD